MIRKLKLREIRAVGPDRYEVTFEEEDGSERRVACRVFEHRGVTSVRPVPDVFMTGGSLSASFPPDGDPTAKPDPKLGDRIDLGGGKFVPPASPPGQTFLTARTARLIRDLWK